MEPKYLQFFKTGRLKEVADIFYSRLKNCAICPRSCHVNRLEGKLGFCRTAEKAKVYSYLKHRGEEPAVSGNKGSGTIFFAGCNLKCVYCQNFEFSQQENGREVTDEEIAAFCLELQDGGCHNINFVTPSHVLPQILRGLIIAVPHGLKIPLVYNSSGYDSLDSLKLLEGIIDIYLPDARYADEKIAQKYSQAKDYPQINRAALKEMHRQVGVAKLDKNGIIEGGLIIRHLVLPDHLSGTREIMRFIAQELGPETYISLMSQYYPYYKAESFKELSRRITPKEYQEAKDILAEYGLHNGWIQDDHGQDSLAGVNIKGNIHIGS